MAISATVVTVTTAPTVLNGAQSDFYPGSSLALYVPVGGATVYVGDSGVTTATGYPCLPGTEHFFELDPTSQTVVNYRGVFTGSEGIYGIVASATQAVNVLQSGV